MKLKKTELWRKDAVITVFLLNILFASMFIACKTTPAQVINEDCTVSVLNRTANVQPDETWSIPNIPSNTGLLSRATS